MDVTIDDSVTAVSIPKIDADSLVNHQPVTIIHVDDNNVSLFGHVVDIFECIRRNDIDSCRSILQCNPELASKKDWGGTTPLHLAIFLKNITIARLLIEYGATLFDYDGLGISSYNYLLKKDRENASNLKIYEMKINGSLNVTEDEKDFIDLTIASFSGDIDTIKGILDRKKHLVLMSDDRKMTALMIACSNQRFDAAKVLIDYGSNWNQQSSDGGGKATASTYIVNANVRSEMKKYAYWKSPKGIIELQRLMEIKLMKEECAREHICTTLMNGEDNRMRRLILNECTTKKLQLSAAGITTEKVIRLGARTAERKLVQRILDQLENERKEGVLARRLAREEAKRLRRIEVSKIKRRCLWCVYAACKMIVLSNNARNYRLQQKLLREEKERKERLEEMERRRIMNEVANKMAQEQALVEWEALQQEIMKKDWIEYCRKKPFFIQKFNRMKKSLRGGT